MEPRAPVPGLARVVHDALVPGPLHPQRSGGARVLGRDQRLHRAPVRRPALRLLARGHGSPGSNGRRPGRGGARPDGEGRARLLHLGVDHRPRGDRLADHRVSERPRSAAAVSTIADTRLAAEDVAKRVRDALAGEPAGLAVIFMSPEHAPAAEHAAAAVADILQPAALAGSTGEAVIGTGREFEGEPAVSLLATTLPGGRASVHHLSVRQTDDGPAVELPAGLVPPPGEPMLLMADPYSFPADAFLDGISSRFDGAVAVGGLASGGGGPGGHALVCGRRVMRHGAVAVIVEGGVALRVLVSQGCAPVGPEMVITSADGNVIHELAGRSAYERLTEAVAGLDDRGGAPVH